MGIQVELVLRNFRNGSLFPVFIEPTDLSVTNRWLQALRTNLETSRFLEKDFSFTGFPEGSRSNEYLCERLQWAVDYINSYRGPGAWRDGYLIPETFTLATLDQDKLNQLHHHYEILQGQVWSPADHLKDGHDQQLQNAMRLLNMIVHQFEGMNQAKDFLKQTGKIWPSTLVSFVGEPDTRTLLLDGDYNDFSIPHEFGAVVLNYSQRGKPHIDAWRDGDDIIFDSNVSGLRYCSGDFAVHWGVSDQKYQRQVTIPDFHRWLESKGAKLNCDSHFIDDRGNKQGLGFLVVGKVPLRQFSGLSVPEVQQKVALHADIYRIRLHHNGQTTEKTFEYSMHDPDYERKMWSNFDLPQSENISTESTV